jgi:hypothetical protein
MVGREGGELAILCLSHAIITSARCTFVSAVCASYSSYGTPLAASGWRLTV